MYVRACRKVLGWLFFYRSYLESIAPNADRGPFVGTLLVLASKGRAVLEGLHSSAGMGQIAKAIASIAEHL